MNTIKTELYEKLTRLQWLLHRQHLRGHAMNGPMADTSRGQGRILAILQMKDGISTKDLSYLLGIRVSSLNELLSKLEKNGYIIREQSEQDKRVAVIKLTEKGREVEQSETDNAGIFDCLTGDEQANFGIYLDKIVTALQEEFGDTDENFDEAMRERLRAMRGHRQGFGAFGHAEFNRFGREDNETTL